MDSTDIMNKNGLASMTGYGRKFKNKRAVRLHCTSDSNNVLHSVKLTPANTADVKMTIPLLTEFFVPFNQRYHAPLYVGADKGYVCDNNKKNLKKMNICLVYPYKKNQKKRNRVNQKDVLKKRYRVEHANSQFKRNYKRLNQLYDRSMRSFMTFIEIANTCQIIKNMK